eukprot:403376097
MSFRKSEVHKVLEESQFNENSQQIPIGGDGEQKKDHRFTFNIGAFSDGLPIRRLLSDFDETIFGIQKNQMDQLRRYFTHSTTFLVNNHAFDTSFSYEYDIKQSKFIAKEKSFIFKIGPSGSNWKLKFDATQRKNLIDRFSSKEFLREEIMLSYKQSIGLEYLKFDQTSYRKLDIDLALPNGLGHHHGMPSFLKVDGFIAKTISLVPQHLNFCGQIQGGFIRPLMGSQKTTVNDRFFITNSMGYTHLGHIFKSNSQVELEKDPSSNYKKKIVGDDLGSENYLLLQGRLEFLNIPYIRDIGMRAFTFGEAAIYPSLINQDKVLERIGNSTRLSAGFGLAFPINPQVSIMLYYNALNFNCQKGDYARKSYINVSIGFF